MTKHSTEYSANEASSLEHALRDRNAEIALLTETAEMVSSQFDLETVFKLVVERVHSLINAETVLIPLLDKDCEHYTYRAGYGKDADEIVGESLPLDFGVCGWVWRHKRPWWQGVLDELAEDERNKWEKEAGTILLVPLFGKRNFLGGLAGINKIGAAAFSERDLQLLTLFANQVSIAIENAMFFDEMTAAKQQSEAYQQELQVLNADLERRVEARTMELAEANKKLKKMALHDALTGLPNRVLIQDRLEYSILRAKRDRKPLTIMMMDLDRFKEINDTLGHHVGDLFLTEISLRVRNALRESDTVGRLGGDEFAILLPGTDRDSAELVAAKILDALGQPLELEGNKLLPAGSLGIAVFPDHGQDEADLLRFADAAMYTAKRSRGGFFVYDPGADQNTHERLELASELRDAIKSNAMQLYYQPQIELSSGRVIRVEALARWTHPERGMIPPDVFIPVLEQTGLIRMFSYWALNAALAQCAEWLKSPETSSMSIGVNLSMHNLGDPSLPDQLEEILSKWNLEGSCLTLELTESTIMNDPEQVMAVLSRLKKTRVRFSVDDFGTGYSSLAYLKKLPVDELKIDRSFVMDMAADQDDAMIVRSVIHLAHNLGLEVVAEGVESQEILELLKEHNCDIAQGYHICRPMPVEQLNAFLNENAG